MEREFGVPIPGRIVEPERWTKTALKRLPESGALNFPAIFGRQAPIVLDLGCGNGRFLLGSALLRPECDHLGVDILPLVIRYATRRANQRGLANVRWAVIGGRELLERHIEPHSIAEIHVYHPQPYYELTEYAKRLVTPEFLWLVRRSLVAGGRFIVQTDNAAYWRYIAEIAPRFFDFREQPGPWPDTPKGRTRREIYATKHGLRVFRGIGTATQTIEEAAARSLIAELPRPEFDAGRRPVDDEDERG